MSPIKNFMRRSWSLDFTAFVFLFSALTFICVAFYTFDSNFQLGFYEVYTAGIMLAAFVSSALALLLRPPKNWLATSRRDILVGMLIFLFGLALGLYRLDFFSVWLDEEVQAYSTRMWPGFGVVRRAASSLQMPLGYYFTALNWDLAGANEWGLRLFSCLFIAGSGVLFYRLARLLCKSPLLYSVAPFIYLLNPWLIRYSQEGRPYGLVIFCGLLWLNSVHDFFKFSEERGRILSGSLGVFSSTLLFLFSATLQPAIFCAAFLFVFGFLLFFRSWRKRVWALYAAALLAAIAAIPPFQLAREASLNYFYPIDSWSSWERVLRSVLSFPQYANTLLLGQVNFLALAFVLAPITLARPWKRANGPIWIGLASCLVFGIFFLAPFSLIINYPIFARYYLIFYPLAMLVIVAYFDQLSALFEAGRDRYLKWGWQLVFLAALAAPPARALPEVYFSNRFDRWGVDSKSLFQFFRQTGTEGDVGYVIPFADPRGWEQNGFLATDFYYPENSPVRVTSFRRIHLNENASDLILKDLPTQNPKQIFLTLISEVETEIAPFRRYCGSQPGVDLRIGERYLICKVLVKGSFANTLEKFFLGLIPTLEEKEKAYRMYDILLNLAEYEKNRSKCQARLSDLKKLNSKLEQIQEIIRNHESRCAELSPRARR